MSIIEDERPADELGRLYRLCKLLQRVHTYAITTKSDYARIYADEIAEASSRGLLTTRVVPKRGIYGRLWKITQAGISYLELNAELIADEEVEEYGAICNGL